jgi:hypothetical protein
MAYAQSAITRVEWVHGGRRFIHLTFTETEAAATSEWSVTGLPRCLTLTRYNATLTAGTGTTINPKLGRATGWSASTQDDIGTNSTTAAHINDNTKLAFVLLAAVTGDDKGTLFGCSQANNAAADHSISTELTFVVGHFT